MPDNDKGLIKKYHVERVDGGCRPGGKHEDCSLFVLDPQCDKHARKAIEAYAESCADEIPMLSNDLMIWLDAIDRGERILENLADPTGTRR